MKSKLISFLAVCSLMIGISMVQSTEVQAQQRLCIPQMDFWDHEMPAISKSGDWLSIFIYPYPTPETWEPGRYTISAQIKYSNGKTINVPSSMFSSGVDVSVPSLPSGVSAYPTLIVTLVDVKGNCGGYRFSGTFWQR